MQNSIMFATGADGQMHKATAAQGQIKWYGMTDKDLLKGNIFRMNPCQIKHLTLLLERISLE